MLGILSNDMHQDFTADPDLDGLEVVISGFFASKGVPQYQRVSQEMTEAAQRAVELVQARHLAGKRLAEMSTGEARRILIARALVSNPRALMLDEPTAGLDLASRRRFLHSVRQISRRQKTIILVTHHVEEIIPEINRVILIKDGAVFDDGDKESILTNKRFSALFDEPIEVRKSSGGYYSAEIELLAGDRISDLD